MVERVEIIRGPSSSLYGTSAFFAVVNVVTKSGSDLQGLELSGEQASFESFKGRVSYGNQFKNGVEMVVSASVFDSAGQDLFFAEFTDVNGGWAKDADYHRFRNVFAKVSYKDFSFQSYHVSRKKGIPTASYGGWFNDNRTFTIDGQTQFRFDYEHTFGNGFQLSS